MKIRKNRKSREVPVETQGKYAGEQRRSQLWFLESMDRINRTIQGTDDLERMMSDAFDAALSIFGCDRAWMVYPCDPESQTWRTVIERARPAFADSSFPGRDFPMDAEVAHMHRIVRSTEAAVRFGLRSDNPIPAQIAERFSVRSQICLAVDPKIDNPYIFGLDQCSRARSWTLQEQRLFEAIGQRLAVLLNGLLMSRDLQESKARLEEAQRVAHVGYWIWDLNTDRVTWSDETYRIYGLRPQEGPIALATIREMIHPEDRESVFQTAEKAVLGALRPDAEHRIVRLSGEVRTVHSQGDLKRDASGRPYEMFGTVQDITDRKRAEETLKQTQTYLREGQRLAHMGSWAFNDLGAYWSDELYQIFGLDPGKEAPTVEQFLAIIHPQDRPSMAETINGMFQQHCGCDVTNRIVRPDGQLRYIRFVANPVVERGVFKGFLGTVMDVTEQELLTQELRREQAYLTDAQSMAHIGSWAYNLATHKLLHSSDENARLYGFDPSQGPIPAERFFETQHAEDAPHVNAALERAVREGTDFYLDEYRIHHTDGSIRFLRAIGHRNPSGESGEYVGITMDITERKRAEEERERLHQLEADLSHINRVNMMGELAAALAHEIKQPIAASITSANTCLRWLAHDPPNLERARGAATRSEQEGNRAADVINRLRSFYKKGKPPERKMVDVKAIIREMTALFKNDAVRHAITIHPELDRDVPRVLGDRVQLQQVFMNLMLNAIEAMKETGGELTVRARLNPEGQLVFSISDTGVGLPAENTERIFDAFHTTKPQGTGMGLAITRSIVESHGGRVWATANEGPGATFHFTLPAEAKARA
jgi:PAS domain S-box-containing protein